MHEKRFAKLIQRVPVHSFRECVVRPSASCTPPFQSGLSSPCQQSEVNINYDKAKLNGSVGHETILGLCDILAQGRVLVWFLPRFVDRFDASFGWLVCKKCGVA